jgi:tetratricopeptide (TPR) repeat protein
MQTVTKKEIYSRLLEILKLEGDGKNEHNNSEALGKLNQIITENPEYSDAYFLRAMLIFQITKSNDYQNIIGDIDNAIKFSISNKYKSAYQSNAGKYSLRAKVEKEMGNYLQALQDFETAVKTDPGSYSDILNVSGVKAEEVSTNELWTKRDFDELIATFPSDYRTHLFRGYFFSFFTTFDEKYYSIAIADYEKAINLDSTSALSYFLLGEIYEKGSFWTMKVWSDLSGRAKDEYHKKVVEELNKAIELNPQFKEAYISRANSYYSLQEYKLAIADYDKIIEIEPHYSSAYNDRGLANFNIGEYYNAISDFDKAIEEKANKDDLSNSSYKNRADAYMKVDDYKSAILDYSKAIENELNMCVILMNLSQFRAIYPEYLKMPDKALTKMLWDKFNQNLKYNDFADLLYKNKEGFSSTIVPDLYVSRGDAYLNYRQFKNAVREYSRAIKGFPEYAESIDRWRLFASSPKSEHYLDIKDVEYAQNNVIEFWTKEIVTESQNNIAFTKQHWSIRCSSKTIKLDSSIDYDPDGNVINTTNGGGWQQIVPDTFGEVLYKDWCTTTK